MFAILLTEETFPKILEDRPDLFDEKDIQLLKTYLNKERYLITGHTSPRGKYNPWIVYFKGMFKRHYEYDEDKIKTDWVQIVRK